ncbi:MAG: OmpW family outer membrane protein, partial [Burkholderiales bacterium]
AAQGDWLGRARVISINPDASSSALNLDASTETTLEPDFTYFVTHNLGMELILATKKHDITAGGKPVGQDQPAGSRRQDEVLMAVVSR